MTRDTGKNKNAMRYLGLGMQLAIMLLAALFAGWKIDEWIGWKAPVFLLVLSLSTLGYTLWKLVKETGKK
jgi:hypothetical protein